LSHEESCPAPSLPSGDVGGVSRELLGPESSSPELKDLGVNGEPLPDALPSAESPLSCRSGGIAGILPSNAVTAAADNGGDRLSCTGCEGAGGPPGEAAGPGGRGGGTVETGRRGVPWGEEAVCAGSGGGTGGRAAETAVSGGGGGGTGGRAGGGPAGGGAAGGAGGGVGSVADDTGSACGSAFAPGRCGTAEPSPTSFMLTSPSSSILSMSSTPIYVSLCSLLCNVYPYLHPFPRL
jgi:hypothetical protein